MLGGYGLSLVTAPTEEPLSLPQAKRQCGLPDDFTYHDEELTRLISIVRNRAELFTGRQFLTATWDLYLDRWPCDGTIFIPLPRLQSISSITYVDGDGASQTWSSSNYVVSTSREPGIVRLAYGVSFPTVRYQPDAIRVRFVAGYGSTSSAVPPGLVGAMLLLLRDLFENRSAVMAGTINELPAAKHLLLQHLVGDEFTSYAGERPDYSVSA